MWDFLKGWRRSTAYVLKNDELSQACRAFGWFAIVPPKPGANGVFLGVACMLGIIIVATMFVANDLLTVQKHVNGEFWIRGFSKEFLSRIDVPFVLPPPE